MLTMILVAINVDKQTQLNETEGSGNVRQNTNETKTETIKENGIYY